MTTPTVADETGMTALVLMEQWLTRLQELAPRMLLALLVLAFTFLLARAAGRIAGSLLSRGRMTRIQIGFFRHLAIRLVQFAGLAVILDVLGFSGVAKWLAASGGIVAVIVGFAFREIGENLIAGLFLAYRSPFRVGDLVRSGSLEGIVQSIDLRATHIRTEEGSDIFIPNSKILNQPVVNYTLDGNRRASFELRLGIDSDIHDAARVLRSAAGRVAGVSDDPPVDLQLKEYEGEWLRAKVTLWVDVFEEQQSLETVRSLTMDACRRALADAGFRVDGGGLND